VLKRGYRWKPKKRRPEKGRNKSRRAMKGVWKKPGCGMKNQKESDRNSSRGGRHKVLISLGGVGGGGQIRNSRVGEEDPTLRAKGTSG